MAVGRRVRRNISQRSELIYDMHHFGLNVDSREVFLMSDSTSFEEAGIDWCCANTFLKNMSILNSISRDPILVHQCTIGGDWYYGMAIYDIIAASPSPVVLLAHGHARSMSSIIPQAAKRRYIMPSAFFMIHFGSAGYEGDSRSFVAEGAHVSKLDEQMLDVYVSRCANGPFWKRNKYSKARIRTEIRSMMNIRREVYLTPDEAVDFGFMDGVFGTKGAKTLSDIRKFGTTTKQQGT